jgi:GNAT superfamily N-acetyltransferase
MRSADPRIRELRDDDLHDALALSTSAGWNQQLDDWRMLRALAGRAAFAAEIGGRVTGTALALDYGDFAWIAMMLVEPGARGQGLGTLLLSAALKTVSPDRPVWLDATPAGRSLYRKFGFHDAATLTRFVSRRTIVPDSSGLPSTRPMTVTDLPLVGSHDVELFGGDRSRVLAWALQRAPHYARLLDRTDGPPQYAFGRPGRLFDQIGPVVAANEQSAKSLVTAALASAAGRSVVIDAFETATGFPDWLRACGFSGERPLYRMRRPPAAVTSADRASAEGCSQFAICGPDFA